MPDLVHRVDVVLRRFGPDQLAFSRCSRYDTLRDVARLGRSLRAARRFARWFNAPARSWYGAAAVLVVQTYGAPATGVSNGRAHQYADVKAAAPAV